MSAITTTFTFLNRITAGSFAAQVLLFAYKKHIARHKQATAADAAEADAGAAAASAPSPSSSSSSSSHSSSSTAPSSKHATTSWPARLRAIADDAAGLWAVGAAVCLLNQAMQRALERSRARSRVGVAAQFAFGAGMSLVLHQADPQRWRQGIFAGLCINSAFETAYQLVFGRGAGGALASTASAATAAASRERLGHWLVKLAMTVVGAQLSHAFILTPFSMAASDCRFFRLASGHSTDSHERVVVATGGALRYADLALDHGGSRSGSGNEEDAGQQRTLHHEHHQHGHVPLRRQQQQQQQLLRQQSAPSAEGKRHDDEGKAGGGARDARRGGEEGKAASDVGAAAPIAAATTACSGDTFCRLVHPHQADCLAALGPSFRRAFKMALLLYTPFLSVQIVRALAAGKLSSDRLRGALFAYGRLVGFLTTFSGLVQWLPCFLCRVVDGCRHDSRYVYFVSGLVSSGAATLWDSTATLRGITLVLLPRAIQSAILNPVRQRAFMRGLAAASLGLLFALNGAATPGGGGVVAYVVRSVRGSARP